VSRAVQKPRRFHHAKRFRLGDNMISQDCVSVAINNCVSIKKMERSFYASSLKTGKYFQPRLEASAVAVLIRFSIRIPYTPTVRELRFCMRPKGFAAAHCRPNASVMRAYSRDTILAHLTNSSKRPVCVVRFHSHSYCRRLGVLPWVRLAIV